MFNFLPKRFLFPDTTGTGTTGGNLNPIAAVNDALAAVQTGIGIVKSIGAKKRINNLIDQLTPYTTPDSFYQGFNLTESRAQGDTVTRQYQTNALDNTFASYLSSATNLGADPNALSAAFGQKIQGMMQIGEQFHQSNTEAFSAMLQGYNALAQNKTAEWASKNNRIKDKIQAENANFKTANDNINNGLNSLQSSLSAQQIADMFKQNVASGDTGIVGSRISVAPVGSMVPSMVNSTSYINPNP